MPFDVGSLAVGPNAAGVENRLDARSPVKSDEGSTADDSDPQELNGSSQDQDDMGPQPWHLPLPGLAKDFSSLASLLQDKTFMPQVQAQLNSPPINPYLSADGQSPDDAQRLGAQWLQNEMMELVEMMCQREAEMQQLEWQLSALSGTNPPPLESMPPMQIPMQRAALDSQVFNLQSQLNQLMSSLRVKQLTTPPATEVKIPEIPPVTMLAPEQEKVDEEDVFTVMMRNLPNKYTQRMLIDEINEVGFDGAYDFLYLPIDKESGANKGYAFVNFVRPDLAYAFKLAYDGKRMAQFKSNKIVSVAPATIQGFEANYDHFSRTRVNYGDVDSRPLFLKTKKGKAKTSSLGGLKSGRNAPVMGMAQAQDMGHSMLPGSMSPIMATNPSALTPAVVAPEASFCPFCGTRRAAHFLFCQGCGTKF